jgi:hypothetical protein
MMICLPKTLKRCWRESKAKLKMPNKWFKLTQHDLRYGSVLVASLTSSAIGICYAAHHNYQDGGRGGAVAVAIAFAALFVRHDFGQKAYDTVAIEVPKVKQELAAFLESMYPSAAPAAHSQAIENLTARIDGLVEQVRINSSGQSRQNGWLAAASIVGTLAWGFGDWIAHTLQAHPLACFC